VLSQPQQRDTVTAFVHRMAAMGADEHSFFASKLFSPNTANLLQLVGSRESLALDLVVSLSLM
jgi:hypothetical protein